MLMQISAHHFHSELTKIYDGSCFSQTGRWELWDYFNNLENDLGEQIKFNPIEVCAYYKEYETKEALEQFDCESLEDLKQDVVVVFVDENDLDKIIIKL